MSVPIPPIELQDKFADFVKQTDKSKFVNYKCLQTVANIYRQEWMRCQTSNFLKSKKEYALFAAAAIEAEKIYASAPAMCAVGCRKALELAVKWVYSADNTMQMPYKDNLQALIT